MWAARAFTSTLHRARWSAAGELAIPTSGPCIVIANHVSGLDPTLVQLGTARPIRWMMERAMMIAPLGAFWRWLRVIPVDPATGTHALREALRHLAAGGALGIFPEGRIARPKGRIQVFSPGLAWLAARSKAKVAIFVVEGIPQCGHPLLSYFRPSRAHTRLLAVVDPPRVGEEEAWTMQIRRRMADALGVPLD